MTIIGLPALEKLLSDEDRNVGTEAEFACKRLRSTPRANPGCGNSS